MKQIFIAILILNFGIRLGISQESINQIKVGELMPKEINLGGFKENPTENCNCRVFTIEYDYDLNESLTRQSLLNGDNIKIATVIGIHYNDDNIVVGKIKSDLRIDENKTLESYRYFLNYNLSLINQIESYKLITNEEQINNDYSSKYYSYSMENYDGGNYKVIRTVGVVKNLQIEEVFIPYSSYIPRFELKDLSNNSIDNTNQEQDISKKIFMDVVRENPIFVAKINYPENNYIVGVIDKSEFLHSKYVFTSLSLFGDKWYKNQSISYGQEYIKFELIDPFELVELNENYYIYFSISEIYAGTAVAGISTIKFVLFNPLINQFVSLDYFGKERKDNTVEGEFENIDEFKNNQSFLSFLEEKVKNCSLIYRPSAEDLDISNAINFEKKWQIDNTNLPNIYSETENKTGKLKLTFYSSELMPFNDASELIENEKYIIATFFRSNVVGYNKSQKKYFPVWIESCNHGCYKTISFETENYLKITWDELVDPVSITIDLENYNYIIK